VGQSLGVEDEVDELADVPPEQFVAARDALAKQLKADGKTAEAAEVKKLRKPTVTRWVADQVLRHHAADVDALRRALDRVAAAQEAAITRGDRTELSEATAERRDAVTALERAVDEVLADHERPAHHRDEAIGAIEADVSTEVTSRGTFGVRDDLEIPDRPGRAQKPARDRVAERREAQAQAAIKEAEARVDRAREELARAEAALTELLERHGGRAAGST
jgi:DNA repair exonuclease SbcCD ATPase subunit